MVSHHSNDPSTRPLTMHPHKGPRSSTVSQSFHVLCVCAWCDVFVLMSPPPAFFLTAHFSEEDYPYEWLMLWLSRRPEWQRSREFETTTNSSSPGYYGYR